MDKDDIEKSLGPYSARLRECIVYGHDRWHAFGVTAGELRAPLDSRARACFIYCHIIARVWAIFADDNSVRVVNSRGFVELALLKERLIVRFKKLNKNGISSNILTRAQRRWFEDHQKLPEMPPEATKLIAGYVLDEITANLSRVLVTLPNGPSAVMWKIELPEDGSTKVVEMQRQRREPKAPPVRSRVRKKQDQDDPKKPDGK